jgi:hypothetical protein
MKKYICISFLVLVISSVGCGKMEDRYQYDMDIIRLNDLKVLGYLVEEYHEKKGHYPFEKQYKDPLYIHITTKGQREYAKQRPPYAHILLDVKELITEIESGIGRKVDLPFDPQKVPVSKPNFYIYKMHKGYYYFAVHLYNEFSFARKVGPHYHKVEISNFSEPSQAIWKFKDLMQSRDFIKASNKKLSKPGYVKAMREKMYKEGAF